MLIMLSIYNIFLNGGRSGFDGKNETEVACTGCRWPVKKRLIHNR